METGTGKATQKRSVKKTLLWVMSVFLIVIVIVALYLYNNFNRILTDALVKNFNSNIISDVYSLKFEKLSVNFLDGNVKVYNVEFQPREKPLHDYPYINSSLRLKTAKMYLDNVELMTVIKSNILKLDKIEITEPDVELRLNGDNYVLFPFKDTTRVATPGEANEKKGIESFFLKEFRLVDASFHVTNVAKERELRIQQLNISLKELMIDQRHGSDIVSDKRVDLSVGNFTGSLKNKAIKYVNFKDFKITIDSLDFRQTIDTTIYHYADFTTGLNKLDIQTADSISHLTMDSFHLSYSGKSIKLRNVSFKPNISDAAIQKKFVYRTTLFSGTFGTMDLLGVNFDSLIYRKKILIDEVVLDKVSANIFTDQRKPVDKKKFPKYPGQQIKGIPVPLLIQQLKATNVNLANKEQKPDGSFGRANINRGTLNIKNITTLPSGTPLTVNVDAFIENKAHANVTLRFDYDKPQYGINATIKRFNLPDLNPLIQSYTPASIEKGIADEISFSGYAYRTNANGTMKFLYHDLNIGLAIKDQVKWANSALAFVANKYLEASNPGSPGLPPRIVQYHVARDMNKGFVNILIKSVLGGLKETMIMSKENRKTYKKAKKEAKKKAKKRAGNK